MLKKKSFFTVLILQVMLIFTGCSTIQTAWKIDARNIEKDIAASKKNGVIVFTASDSDEVSKNLIDDICTEHFFSKAGKYFVLYNVNIVKDEALMPAKELEKNYILFSEYNILEVPHLCILNKDGDAFYSGLIPAEIKTSDDFAAFLYKQLPDGETVAKLRHGIEKKEGFEKIKAVDEFFNSVYFVDSEKYKPLLDEGIKSDPENKSGLTGKFVLAKKQLVIDKLLLQKKYDEAIGEFNDTLNMKILKPEEEQAVWCNIAYIAALSQKYSKTKIIGFLENALKAAASSSRAEDIKADIDYLKKH